MKDCLALPPTNFSIFKFKKSDLKNLFDHFLSTVLFSISFCLYRACFTHLISSILSCSLCLWYYHQLVHFDKDVSANVYRLDLSLWDYSKRVHCSFEWHLTPHMTLSIETCIRRTPCIKQTLQLRHSPIPKGVRLIQVSLYNETEDFWFYAFSSNFLTFSFEYLFSLFSQC